MAGYLRVEVHLVDAVAIKPGDARLPVAGVSPSDRDEHRPPGALFADLEPGPAVCRAPGRLWTGVPVGRGFRPGRLVSRSADGQTRHEWACRGSVLEHLLAIREWALDRAWVLPLASSSAAPEAGSSSRATTPTRAIAHVLLSLPARLWHRGRLESKDARARAAVVAVFGHALCDWDNPRDNLPAAGASSSASATSAPRAGFCGVIGCDVHDPRRGRRGTLKTALENLRPPTLSPRNVEPEIPGFPCPADLGDDVVDRVASFLDARGAAALAATCGGMRDRMDAHAAGLALRLHPHQRAGLAWMRRRERPVGSASNPPIVDPRWTGPIRTRDERAPYWLNTVTGELCTTAPPSYPDAPGGLLCDEPGLGKTVTALALTLARRGARASPPQGCRARTCEKTGGWYYVARPRLGDGDGDAGAAGVRAGTPDGTSDGEVGTPGDAKERRRSKRSRSSTPVGHFAAMERAAFELINPSAKRRKSSAAFVRDSEVDRSGDFSPAAPSRLGPRFAEAPTSADEDKKIKIESSANENEPGPPKGFRPLRASAARVATERATSQRNVAHFQTALASARRAVGSSAVEETCEFVLMNRGGAGPITADDPLLLPKWRFNGDLAEKALVVLYALGLVPCADGPTRKDWVWVPPANASTARREPGRDDENDDANEDVDVAFAFDAESLDEAISLDRGGGVEGAEVWLSSATLVVLPPVLISHWLEQIAFTTASAADGPSVCVVGAVDAKRDDAAGSFAIDGEDADADRWLFGVEGETRDGSRSERADGEATASSSASAWTEGGCSKSTRARQRHDALPSFDGVSPRVLASRWDVVLIPVNRLSAEFSRVDSPLLRVHWQRVVLDEGHQLGGASAITAKLSVACALRAHARWVMTGTPTPATLRGAGVGHLQPLLAFLRQPPFGSSQQLWMQAIQKPLESAPRGNGGNAKGGARTGGKSTERKGATRVGKEKEREEAFDGAAAAAATIRDASAARDAEASRAEAAARLGALLRRSTIRTLKSDIRLPPLVREVTPLSFTRAHAKSYNELVSFLRRGLLLADWADPSHEESLLNPRRARLATEAVANLREAACVTGEFPVTCFAEEIDETVSDLVAALTARGASRDVAVARAEELRYPLTNHRGTCARCRADSFLPMLTPCGHLLCSGCVAVVGDEDERGVSATAAEDFIHEQRAPRRCPVCASSYVMQAPNPRPDNPSPRQAVPQDLIEIQPSYVQHAWRMTDALEAQGESTKVDRLLARLREIGAAPSASDRAAERAAELGLEAGASPDAVAAAAAAASSGSNAPRTGGYRWVRPARKGPPPKVIVYSGFRTHAAVIDLALTSAGVNFENIARMGMTRAGKDAALASFRGDPQTAVLLLDRAAAEGLDLSFASRVFVMEPLDNASLEQQVVSRAHRMGQRWTVRVEVLAMRGTAEETLLDVQAELAAAAAAEARARERADDERADDERADDERADDERADDDDGGSDEGSDVDAESRIAAAALGAESAGGVEPAVAAEALSRRRVLQSLKLVPIPAAEDEDAAEAEAEANAVAANTAANVAANAKRALEAANGDAPKTAERTAPRRRAVMFAEDPEPVAEAGGGAPNGGSGARSSGGGGGGPSRSSPLTAGGEANPTNAANATPIRPRAASPPPPPDTLEWRVRVRAVRAYTTVAAADAAAAGSSSPASSSGFAPPPPVTIRLPEGGATAVATLRRLAEEAFSAAAAPRSFAARALAVGIPPRPVADDADRASIASLGVVDQDVVSATLISVGGDDRDIVSPNAAATAARTKTNASGSGTRLGGSPLAAGVGGVRPRVVDPSPPSSGKKRATTVKGGVFKGTKRKLGSSDARVAVGVGAGETGNVTGGETGHVTRETEGVGMASAAAAEMAGGGSAPSLDAEALNRRVARRTAAVAAADATSTGAMLLDPDDPDGTDGAGVSGSAASMAADLMRAAEGEAARGIASDPVVASLQNAMRAVVLERAAEAEGNRKVSAATSGRVAFQSLPDGRLVVRYAVPDVGAGQSSAVGERTEVVQDLPAGLLPVVLRVVALDQSKEARANLAPAAMAVASPRVFWAVVRHGGVGGARGRGFVEALEALAPGAADWAAVATRERRKPERYSEYVSH